MCAGCGVRDNSTSGREIDIFSGTAWLVRHLIGLVAPLFGRVRRAAA